MNRANITFEVSRCEDGWQVTGAAGVLYAGPTMEGVLEFARSLAWRIAPARVLVLRADGAVDREMTFERGLSNST